MTVANETTQPSSARRAHGTPLARTEPIHAAQARASVLRQVVAETSASLELDQVFAAVLASARSLFGTDVAGLWLHDPGRHPLRLAAHHDLAQQLIDAASAVTRRRGDRDGGPAGLAA